jgi:hypothetical protein
MPFFAYKLTFFVKKLLPKHPQTTIIHEKMGKLPTVLKKPRLVGFPPLMRRGINLLIKLCPKTNIALR